METARRAAPQYVTDAKGRKTAIIVPIDEYEELLQDVQDLAVLAERRDERPIPHEQVVAELKKHGYL